MSNVLIAYNSHVDGGTLSGGSWSATLPLTNLQNRVISKVARSADLLAASTKFDIDVKADNLVRVIGLVGHNLSLTATWRARLYSDAGFTTLVYDSGTLNVWPAAYASTSLSWQASNWWSGAYTEADRAGYTWSAVHVLAGGLAGRYWRIEMFDASNANGYVEVGRLFMADGWQPAKNMSYGASLAWEDRSEVQEALSGTEYFDTRTPYRVARIQINWMDEDEAMGNAFELQRRAGISREVFFLWDPEDTAQAIRRQFMGRLRQLSPIEHPYLEVHKTSFEIKELL